MVLWGIDRLYIQTLNEATLLPDAQSEIYQVNCAESLAADPQFTDAVEETKVCPSTNRVLAERRLEPGFYGYDITLTDNEFTMDLFRVLNGFEGQVDVDTQVLQAIWTPLLQEGPKFKPFRLVAFSAGYEGSTISKYVVFVWNFCRGAVTPFTLEQDWTQIEYTIQAREATAAQLPVMSIGYWNSSTLPENFEDITIVSGVIAPNLPATASPTGQAIQLKATTQAIPGTTKTEVTSEAAIINNKTGEISTPTGTIKATVKK